MIHNRRTKGLPLETICDIFLFIPVENLLACNWTCLRLFRASQILYRPLQRPCQQRIIQHLAITFNIDHNFMPFTSAQFHFRLLENDDVYVRKYTFKCRRALDYRAYQNTNTKCSTILTDNCLLGIQRPYTGKCWPNGPHLVQSLPAVGLPSDIVTIERIDLDVDAIERIDLDLASKERYRQIQHRCCYNYIDRTLSEAGVYCSQKLVSKMSCHPPTIHFCFSPCPNVVRKMCKKS